MTGCRSSGRKYHTRTMHFFFIVYLLRSCDLCWPSPHFVTKERPHSLTHSLAHSLPHTLARSPAETPPELPLTTAAMSSTRPEIAPTTTAPPAVETAATAAAQATTLAVDGKLSTRPPAVWNKKSFCQKGPVDFGTAVAAMGREACGWTKCSGENTFAFTRRGWRWREG